MTQPIRLIAADIDGCFTAGGRSHVDLEMAARVAEWNRLSVTEATVPALVFCTGRPLPYIQALSQVIAAQWPSISEFGAVLWCPRKQTHAIHPDYSDEDRARYSALVAHAEEYFDGGGRPVLIEAGKVCQLTLYPRHPATVREVVDEAEEFVARWREHFVIEQTPAVLNFMPRAVNKGTALEWLSRHTEIPLSEMAGIGDSDNDWDFLQHCGISSAPRNAQEGVRERSTWKLDSGPGECIVELYERVIAYNETALGGGAYSSSNEE